MRPVAVSSWLVGSFALACAGTAERATGDAEVEASPAVASAPGPSPTARVAHTTPPSAAPAASGRGEAPPFDSRWADEVRAVVSTYESWGRVDDEFRWAPWLCRIPRAASAHVSESDDAKSHGHKLYTLYALDPEAYGAPRSAMMSEVATVAGLSQVIVKESFSPVPLDDALETKLGSAPNGGVGEHGLQPAERDGRRFVAGDRKGLFIMMKTDPPAEGTDAGWVYATVEPDMITVTAVGVIESCVGCHAEAGDDRLFGLPGLAGPADHGNANAVPL